MEEREKRPLDGPELGPIVERVVPILVRTLKIPGEELLANADMRILENRQDPEEDTLGASSIQALRAKNAVEEAYGFKVPDDQLAAYRSLRTIVERIELETGPTT